jgi:hypothetical protein
MKINNKKIIVSILAVLLIAIFGYVFLTNNAIKNIYIYLKNNNTNNNIDNPINCTQLDCYFKLAYAEKNLSICDMIDRSKIKPPCYINTSFSEVNCSSEKLSENSENEMKSQCYEFVGKTFTDESSCDSAKNDTLKGACLTGYNIRKRASDPNKCKNIANITQRDNCYLGVIGWDSKPEYCGLIDNSELKHNCYNIVEKNNKLKNP